MCGIVGLVSSGSTDMRLLPKMRDCLAHRGPDDVGEWWSRDGMVGFGHRRLAIIDLTPGGHQPMHGGGGSVHVTFNGEIYNFLELRSELEERGHTFTSHSDTEVLIAAYVQWGESFVNRLGGQFAFALYDEKRRVLLVARDRAGEKPLFYFAKENFFVFGSELKALLAHPGVPRQLDYRALDAYLAYGFVPGDLCMVEGVKKLPAGAILRLDVPTGVIQIERYWNLPSCNAADDGADLDDLVDELDALLADSVKKQLLAADVPVGVLLSGGVDSSLVTAMAARASTRPVKTFTITFPGHGAYDEGPYARMVAEHFGTEHQELVAEPATVQLLPLLARQYDEPMGDSSMIPTYLVSHLIRQHCTVALGGDGGDELFGGYPHYSFILRELRLRKFAPWALRAMAGGVARRLPVGVRGRNHAIALGESLTRTIAHVNLYFDADTRRRLLVPGVNGFSPESLKQAWCRGTDSPLRQAMVTDFKTYLPDDILVKVDRASMLNSLEVRAPFLDHRIIEFAFSRVPDRFRATRQDRKILLRRLGQRILPRQLDLKRKQGFSIPLDRWFSGEFGSFMTEVLAEAPPELFRGSVIRELIEGQRRGRANANRMFILTLFELWRREYSIAV